MTKNKQSTYKLHYISNRHCCC